MKIRCLLIGFFCCLGALRTQAQTVDPNYLDGHLYLKVLDNSAVVLDPLPAIPALTAILGQYGVDSLYSAFGTPDPILQKIYRLEFTNLSGTSALIGALQGLPFIEYAEPVQLIETNGSAYVPNDLQANQWHLVKINAEGAWDISRGDSAVVVAIVDNAVSLTHEDIMPVLWNNPGEIPGNGFDDDFNGYVDDVHGADLADLNGDPSPPANTQLNSPWNHGTHCAGIASAASDNGVGIASIGFNLRVMAVKASATSTGGNTLERAYEGVDYAMRNGADIISMSWGSSGNNITGGLVMSSATSRGIVLVAAAGNSNQSSPYYPAAYNNVIAVGSTDFLDSKSGFSNYGSYIDVMAPGSGIYSSMASGSSDYADLSGTSMACPLVAGLAGLVKSANPSFGPAQVESAIEAGCESIDLQNPNYVGQMGAGRINAFNTLSSIGVGLEQDPLMENVVVYPNPARDRLSLQFADSDPAGSIELFGIDGSLQRRHSLAEARGGIDISNLPRGMYIVRISIATETVHRKVLVH